MTLIVGGFLFWAMIKHASDSDQKKIEKRHEGERRLQQLSEEVTRAEERGRRQERDRIAAIEAAARHEEWLIWARKDREKKIAIAQSRPEAIARRLEKERKAKENG